MTKQSYSFRRHWLRVLAAAGAVSGFGCAGVKPQSTTGAAGASGNAGSGGGLVTGSGGSGVIMPVSCNGPCTDFPTDPIVAEGVSSNAPGMFGTPSAAGPCVTEPEDGALFPNNWLRPRVRVPGNTGIVKITFHADKEANDLVAYGSGETWALPADVWKGLAMHVVEEPVSITVQVPSGGATTVKFQVAPVGAGGSMVFWSADPSQVGKMGVETMAQSALVNDSYLLGFTVGDDSTVKTLQITDVQQPVSTQNGTTQGSHCIGCHVGTPDGDYVGYVDSWPWANAFAGIKPGMTGQPLAGFPGASCTNWNTCTGSRTFVQYPWGGGMAFSKSHWSATDRVAIVASQLAAADVTMPWSGDNKLPGNLVWVDTNSTSVTTSPNGQPFPTRGVAFDYMQHTGDLGGVAFPDWSHDGNTILYASSVPQTITQPGNQSQPGDQDGRLNLGKTDLYTVPYNGKAGGAATAVPGASSASLEEYYPAFSENDAMIAYTAVPAGQVMYANTQAELYVVPFGGGSQTATRLAANDPPACSGMKSPGVNNHWPKWSPDVLTAGSKTYYWIIFSSNRYGLPPVTTNFGGTPTTVPISQLYITAVVKDEIMTYTFPAIYLWNQPQNRLNTTPAWQNFHIPIVID